MLDRAEGTGATQRKTTVAMRKRRRVLARLDLRDLPGPEIRHFDLATDHVDAGAQGIDRDTKPRALHHGGEVGSFDLEMLDVAFFDLE